MHFQQFLTESLDVEKLKHLEHAEDHIIHGGHEGVAHAAGTMNDVLDFMAGKPTKTKITQKYDGAPSIVFGINPENGKFFVATKSAFNVNPKIAYDDADIDQMYGHAPGLVTKLKLALKHLPKVMPKGGGVYQGDLMYSQSDLVGKNGKLSFTPNTVTYSAEKNSPQGKRIQASELGIVVHTKYVGKAGHHKTLNNMVASFDVPHGAFKKDPTVNVINPEIGPVKISRIEKTMYKDSIDKANEIYKNLDDDTFEVLDGHDITLKTYINTTIKDGTTPSFKGYRKFIEDRGTKEIAKLKSEGGKQKKQEVLATALQHLDNHKKQFSDILAMHSHMQKAKDVLVGALARSSQDFETSIGGKPSKPEGFVAIRGGRPSKLVDRAEFSRSNFLAGAFQKSNEQQVQGSNDPTNPVVFSFGRMNPPTTGHKVLVDKVQELAKENNAKHKVVLSRSQDPEKNPLSPEEKIKHAKRFFPTANIEVADESNPSVIHQVKKLADEGHDHLVMVVGADRVEEMKKLLDGYNGKEYNFKKIDVVSAGARDPDAEDDSPESMSATKQRNAAVGNKRKEFQKGVPSHVHPEHAEELFNDVRKRMLDIQIDQNTSGISLGRYAKRQDIIGTKARKEIERREKAKLMQKQLAATRKPRKMRPLGEEAMVATSGDIRGLGYVTGDPAVGSDEILSYLERNIASADAVSDQIIRKVQDDHKSLHSHISLHQALHDRKAKMVAGIVDRFKITRN